MTAQDKDVLASESNSEKLAIKQSKGQSKGGRSALLRAARGAFHAAAETASNVPSAIGEAIEASPLPGVAEVVSNAAGNVAEAAGGAAAVVANAAGAAVENAASAAGQGIKAVQDKAGDIAKTIQENSRENVVKQAKLTAFQDGMRQAEYLIAQKNYDLYCALAALSWYVVRCDGNEDALELAELETDMELLRKRTDVPANIWNELDAIASNTAMEFVDVRGYLDKVGIEMLEVLEADMEQIILADGEITVEEDEASRQFAAYLAERRGTSGADDGE